MTEAGFARDFLKRISRTRGVEKASRCEVQPHTWAWRSRRNCMKQRGLSGDDMGLGSLSKILIVSLALLLEGALCVGKAFKGWK